VLNQWSGDSSQWTQDKKIASMNPLLRPKVLAVLAALGKRGFKPKVFYGWRSVVVQLKLYAEGNTTVKFSFHNAQKPDGTPNSYAADIIDERYAWTAQAESSGFWKALGEEARKQGLYWGGDWTSFRDWAHVQLVPNSQLARVKQESGL
jgi:peptidoglycan L-alanyl-D-glutamate endopeptidase CwlK